LHQFFKVPAVAFEFGIGLRLRVVMSRAEPTVPMISPASLRNGALRTSR
jgi:hypothetical protein